MPDPGLPSPPPPRASPPHPPARRRAPGGLPVPGLVLLALLVLGYVAFHATTLDESWSRPLSRAFQSAIAFTAGLTLAMHARGRRTPRWVTVVGYALLLLALVSPLLKRMLWVPIALGAVVPFGAALLRTGRSPASGGVSPAAD